jgi:energy-coupling factor transport system ATP-binding protein
MATAIEISDLTFAYPPAHPTRPPDPVLRRVSLAIESGAFVALMGPVGAGKSTLCLSLNGLVPQTTGGDFAGRVIVNGLDTQRTPAAEIALHVGMVFQDTEVQLFNASVEDEIAFGLESLGWAPADIETRIDWALEQVGLRGYRQRAPRTLSGGQQKRLAIAAILAMAPPILVLDEPTAGLDPAGTADVLDVIDRLASERRATVVMASQDAEIVARYADRLIILEAGQISADGPPAAIFADLAARPAAGVIPPQMTLLSHLLGTRLGRPLALGTPDEALTILWALRQEGRVACG